MRRERGIKAMTQWRWTLPFLILLFQWKMPPQCFQPLKRELPLTTIVACSQTECFDPWMHVCMHPNLPAPRELYIMLALGTLTADVQLLENIQLACKLYLNMIILFHDINSLWSRDQQISNSWVKDEIIFKVYNNAVPFNLTNSNCTEISMIYKCVNLWVGIMPFFS